MVFTRVSNKTEFLNVSNFLPDKVTSITY